VGSNDHGQLGDGTRTERTEPVEVVGLQSGVAQVSAGGTHTCAVTDDGSLYCWGSDGSYQSGGGYPNRDDVLTPMKLETIDNVKQVAAGSSHTCAIINDGDVMCWGANDDGQLGLGWENPYMFCCSDRNLVIGFGGTNPGP